MSNSQYPSITEPTADLLSLLKTVQELKMTVELLTGVRGVAEQYSIDERVFRLSKVIDSNVGKLAASISQVESVSATADSVQAQRTTEIEAEILEAREGQPTLAARIVEVDTARVSGDEAQASRTDLLEAEVITGRQGQASLSARLTEIDTARVDGDVALATSVSTLTAQVNDPAFGVLNAHARITTEEAVRAASDSATASSLSTLSSSLAGNTASISTLASTTNGLSLRYGITGFINGVTGGFVFTGLLRNDGAVSYNLEINSNVTINGNLVVNGTITTPKVATAAISNEKIAANAVSVLAAGSVGSGPLSFSFFARAGALVSIFCEVDSVQNDYGVTATVDMYVNGGLVRQVTVPRIAFMENGDSGSVSRWYPATPVLYIFAAGYTGTHSLTVNGLGGSSGGTKYAIVQELSK